MNSVGRASHAIGNNTSPNEEIKGEGGGVNNIYSSKQRLFVSFLLKHIYN